jgi:4-hydroxyphenylpyruvate dioxygenase
MRRCKAEGLYMSEASRVAITSDNPMGTDGFEFVEYTAPDPELLRTLFERFGFPVTARHRHKNVTLHRQGDINFIINAEPDSFAQRFAQEHGPSACAMAFRVKDAAYAYRRAIELGAKPVETDVGPMELKIPAIEGIGGSLIYLVDRYGERTIYDVDFVPVENRAPRPDAGLTYIDHLTHNVARGNMNKWAGFYERLFNFREIRYFDIEGQKTGLFSRAMTSQRIAGRQVADRGVSAGVPRRGYSAHRARYRRYFPNRRRATPAGSAVPGYARYLLRTHQ